MKRIVLLVSLTLAALVFAGCSPSAATRELISPSAYVEQFGESETPHVLVDVRTPSEFASGHIAGAINIPVDQIGARLNEIPRDVPVVLYCRSGNRSGQAASILSQNDFSSIYDLGGIIDWQSAGYPVQ